MFEIRPTQECDCALIKDLYHHVATLSGGLARQADEISDDYVLFFVNKTVKTKTSFVAIDQDLIIGEIHAFVPDIRQFFARFVGFDSRCAPTVSRQGRRSGLILSLNPTRQILGSHQTH